MKTRMRHSGERRLARLIIAMLCGVLVADQLPVDRAFPAENDEQSAIAADTARLNDLRARHLYDQAEDYCRQTASASDVSAARRAYLAVELSRTLVARAVHAPTSSASEYWKQAEAAVRRHADSFPNDGWTLLVEVQAAIVRSARGEAGRETAELTGNAELFTVARRDMRAAIRQFETARQRIEARLRTRPATEEPVRSGERGMNRQELASLERHVRYELGAALQNLAQTFAAGSADRVAALGRAAEQFERLAGSSQDDQIAWRSRLTLAQCWRLLGDKSSAERQLRQTKREDTPSDILMGIRAERIHLLLDAGDVAGAAEVALEVSSHQGETSREYDLAALKAFLAAWQQAREGNHPEQVSRWQERCEELLASLATNGGPYWGRRAEILVRRAIPDWKGPNNEELLVQSAETSYRAGRLDDALRAYDQARQAAEERGAANRAFELGFVAASLEHVRKRHVSAYERYVEIARSFPKQPRAAEAHRLAIHHWEKAANDGEINASAQSYVALLDEHVRLWPDSPTCNDIHLRQGRLAEQSGDYAAALNHYRRIEGESPALVAAVAQVEDFCRRASDAEPKVSARLAAAAVKWCDDLVQSQSEGTDQRLDYAAMTDGQLAAALAGVGLRLDWFPGEMDKAERVLEDLLAEQRVSSAWRRRALPWLFAVWAVEGRANEATRRAEELAHANLEDLSQVLARLDSLPTFRETGPKTQVAVVTRLVAEAAMARPEQLSPRERKLAQSLRAWALAEVGRIDEAAAQYAQLRERHPRDARILRRYASLLMRVDDAEAVRKALANWRELEEHSRPESEIWFEAKYGICAAHLALDNRPQAERVYALLRVMHPNLGGPEIKARFVALFSPPRPR